MKVLITVPRRDLPGGVTNYFNILRGHFGEDKQYFEVGQSNYEKGIFSTLRRLCADGVKFVKELRKENYQLVHINPSLLNKSFFRDGGLLLLATIYRKPVLVMFHGWDKGFEHSIDSYLLWLFRIIYGRAVAFMVLANDFRDKLRKWRCSQAIYVETMIVDDQIMNITWDTLSDNRRALSTNAFKVLFLSRLEKEKGIYETIDAFALLKQSVPHASLFIAGDGPDKIPATQYVKEHGIDDVEFMGYVTGKQKDELFASAHVYLFPTYYGEGMPNSVLEAMAFGLPVITRPVGGLKDFFSDGRMGFLTDSLEPHVLAELTKKLANDVELREAMGKYNRSYAKERFSASKVATRLNAVYASIVTAG